MSNAVAQSTSAATQSGNLNMDFNMLVARVSQLKTGENANTKERVSLKRNKLISSCCAYFRAQNTQLFEKRVGEDGKAIDPSNLIPEPYFSRICEAVDAYQVEMMNRLAKDTMTYERKHVHKAKRLVFVENRVLKSEHELAWPEQAFAWYIAVGNLRRRFENAERDNRLFPEFVANCKTQLAQLKATGENIRKHLITPEDAEKYDKVYLVEFKNVEDTF